MESADLPEDRFDVEHQVRAGGAMGAVFRARDRSSGESVAIKVIGNGHDVRDARFAREVQLLSELSHPGIVRYIGHGVAPAGALTVNPHLNSSMPFDPKDLAPITLLAEIPFVLVASADVPGLATGAPGSAVECLQS